MKIEKPGMNQHVKALIYGPSGHGKTRFLGTMQQDPRTSPALLIDFEGGDQSLSRLDMDMVRVRDWKGYSEVYSELQAGTKYKAIGIDSISETETFSLLAILSGETPFNRGNATEDQLTQGDYGVSHIQIKRLIRKFRDLPYHVFITSLSQEVNEVKVGMIKKPALSGKMADEIPGIMDVVGYLAQEDVKDAENKRVLLLKNYPKFRVKIRTPWGATAPDEIEEPDVTKLLDLLQVETEK